MQLETEHGALLESARTATAELDGFYERLYPDEEVSHGQHYEFAMRSRWLSYVLNAALTLADRDAYASAFTVLRSALEHHLIDLLLFLGDRYQQVFTGVSAEDWSEYQDARAAEEEWTRDVIEWAWRDGTLRVVRSGPHLDGGAGTLSIYYGFLSNFDPFQGPPEDQKFLTTGFTNPELHERWARKQRALYSEGLQWKRLRENLALNGMYEEKQLAQLGVHFRFLSAFVHPVSEAYTLLYTRNVPAREQVYDHFASELALLYVNTLAALELRALEEMSGREPQVRILGLDDIRRVISHAEAVSAHLWFPGGTPHEFDRVEEANHRGLVNGHLVPVSAPERLRPDQLTDEDLRYYRNPLARVKKLHYTVHEMTGFPYISPWPRGDAGPL
jgi:hypothetical protein